MRKLKIGCVVCGTTKEVNAKSFKAMGQYCPKCGKKTYHVVEKVNVEKS